MKTVPFILSLALMIFVISCTKNSPLSKSMPTRIPAGSYELDHELNRVSSDLSNAIVFNAVTCADYITGVTDYLFKKGADDFMPQNQRDLEGYKLQGLELMEKLFELRIALRDKIKEYHHEGSLTPECILATRKAFRYTRFMEEFIGEIYVQENKLTSSHLNLEEKPYQFFLNKKKFQDFEIKSGDVIITRASHFVSATISRIGDEDGQFSHGLIIYGDEATGKQYAIEAHLEVGVAVAEYSKWRETGHGRVAVYRYPDAKVAHESAKAIFEKAVKAQREKKPIPYDFKMDTSNYDELFCTEVVKYGYDKGSDGQIILPTYLTLMRDFDQHKFLKNLGVISKSIFAPSDIEIEPKLELVAEWRNYDITRQIRARDAMLSSMMEWMVKKNYYLHSSIGTFTKANLAYFMAQLGFLKGKVPKNMPHKFLKNFLVLEKVVGIMEKYLLEEERKYFMEHGHSMDYKVMLGEMEKFRREDCLQYLKFKEAEEKEMSGMSDEGDFYSYDFVKPPKFHQYFNPKKRSCKDF